MLTMLWRSICMHLFRGKMRSTNHATPILNMFALVLRSSLNCDSCWQLIQEHVSLHGATMFEMGVSIHFWVLQKWGGWGKIMENPHRKFGWFFGGTQDAAIAVRRVPGHSWSFRPVPSLRGELYVLFLSVYKITTILTIITIVICIYIIIYTYMYIYI